MGLIQEAMDKRQLGLPNPRLPPSEAKTRMATVQVPHQPTSLQELCCAELHQLPDDGCPVVSQVLRNALPLLARVQSERQSRESVWKGCRGRFEVLCALCRLHVRWRPASRPACHR